MIRAFLLTRQAYDTPQGIQLELWFNSEQGPLRVLLNGQDAVFFILQSDEHRVNSLLEGGRDLQADIRPIQLKNFNYQPMCAVYCRRLQHFYRLKELLQEHQIPAYESDIRPPERYLTERFITAGALIKPQQAEQNATLVDPLIRANNYEPSLRLMSLDIETAYDSQQLYSIAFICGETQRVLMLDETRQFSGSEIVEVVDNEAQLIKRFIHYVEQLDPDIFTGWNVINFDFRFLQKKADELKIPFKIGRQHSTPRWRQSFSESGHYFLLIPGRVVLDGIDTLKSATWSFASFSLEHVAQELLGHGKLIHDNGQHDPLYKAKEIKRQFHEDKTSLAKYNLQDCQLVLDIFEKTSLIHFSIERARLTGLEMDRMGGSVAAFDNLYLPRLHRKGFTAPNIGDYSRGNTAPGGYVMDSMPGLYDSVLVLDYKSLYPSIIRTFRVDPYARIAAKKLTEADIVAGYDGASFARDDYILPDIIAELWSARDRAKKENNAALSQAIKIIMNSFYGVLGTPGCRLHDARLTSSITKRGHDLIKQTVKLINQQGYEVIYGDTDSVFVSLDRQLDDSAADRIGHQLVTVINDYWKSSLRQQYNIETFLEMEYETHFTRFFMPTIRGSDKGSKKRYAGVINRQGQQQIIFKGLENVRTDWTLLARQFQEQLYNKVFNNESYDAFIRQTVQQLRQGEYDDKLVYRKRLRQTLDQYQKNVPPHARAAIAAEGYFAEQGLPSRYRRKGWIEYVITINGPQTLECQNAKLDYDHYIDKQLTPIADSILSVLDDSMENILNQQISLF